MATFVFSATVVKRSAGRSATAAAAYRSGEELHDRRIDRVFDYTRRRGVLHSEILAPENTPDWMRDRAQLWNAVEAVEKRKDAQLAREVLVSLPHELTPEQRLDLVRDFVREEFVARGMVADLTLHSPDRKGDQRNYHAHVMLTMREITGEGFGKKARDWNATDQLEQWRVHWADAINRALEQQGHAERVDHRSLEGQGIDREPEPKMGPVATEMERDGRPSLAGNDRRAAQDRNRRRAKLKAEVVQLSAEIYDLETERAERRPDAMSDVTPPPAAAPELDDAERRRVEARRQQALKAAAEQADQLAKEQADRLVAQADELRRERERIIERQQQIDARNAELQRIAEEERKRRAAQEAEAREGEIRDAQSRYAQALGDHYDIRDPYGSLARASMGEYGRFKRDREELNRQIAAETDPARRKTLELRRDIEYADYMSITSHRIAGQSEDIVGHRDTDEAVRQREQAAKFEAEAKELRRQYREQVAEQELAKDTEATKTAEPSRTGRASRQRGTRTTRGRTAEASEKEAEAEEADPGTTTEPRQRAQRGERTAGEADHKPDRGPDLER
jgi:hypothetical protein